MKQILTLAFSILALTVFAQDGPNPPFNRPEGWEWTAPETPLPGTRWYDYGWDSTSNGPVPAGAPMLLSQSKATAPPAPMPPTHQVGATPEALALARDYNGPVRPGRVYMDSGLTLNTSDFDCVDYGYGLRLGYQVSRHWGFDFGVGHHGLDADGSAVQDIGGRLVARMPFQLLSPYVFLGGRFNLERDFWTIEPGAGIELGMDRAMRGLSLYAEGNLKATTDGKNTYGFGTGVRLRF